MHAVRYAARLLLLATSVSIVKLGAADDIVVLSRGQTSCRCLNETSWRSSFAAAGNASSLLVNLAVNASAQGSTYAYPFDYGLGSCTGWDEALPPHCADANGTALPSAPSWCQEHWCWVDGATCEQADVTASSHFPKVDAFYSYSTCGSTNTFSTWYETQSCQPVSSPHTCDYLMTHSMWDGPWTASWIDQLGTAHTCGASPRPCKRTTFFEAAAICRAVGGRLCSEEELLNNEVGGTGCGYDAAQTWTSSRGKCAEGAFMSAAGTAYNIAPVPLGLGLPTCTDISSEKAVRCCADNEVRETTCSRSVATCEEVQWPMLRQPDANDGKQFCAGNQTLYACSNGPRQCYERMARPCISSEVAVAIAFLSSIPNTTKAQLKDGHDDSDRCICCADTRIKPEPCVRPHKLLTSDVPQWYSFKTDTDRTRRCHWVFDSDGCTGGVVLRFLEISLTQALSGDGWKVFASAAPTDLDDIQNLRFDRASILAEIQSTEARRFRRDEADMMIEPHGQNFSALPHGDYVVNSQASSLILQLTAMAKGAFRSGSYARFTVEHSCSPAVGGCLDSSAINFQSNASFDDGSCAYAALSANTCLQTAGCSGHGEYICTSNWHSETDECACVVADDNISSFYQASAVGSNSSMDQYISAVAPYTHETCRAMANSTFFVDQVNTDL
eukprot:SAG31_NODE_5255_length_2647_cov_1.946625_2_plen_670_part_01